MIYIVTVTSSKSHRFELWKNILLDEEQTITNSHHIMSVTATAISQKLLQAMYQMWMFNEAKQYG